MVMSYPPNCTHVVWSQYTQAWSFRIHIESIEFSFSKFDILLLMILLNTDQADRDRPQLSVRANDRL
jgi:hypothetical protein